MITNTNHHMLKHLGTLRDDRLWLATVNGGVIVETWMSMIIKIKKTNFVLRSFPSVVNYRLLPRVRNIWLGGHVAIPDETLLRSVRIRCSRKTARTGCSTSDPRRLAHSFGRFQLRFSDSWNEIARYRYVTSEDDRLLREFHRI